MGKNSAISWTNHTWNPWVGCFKVSAGCKNCYFYRDSKRYGNDPKEIRVTKPATFNAPLKWARTDPGLVFMCSWSDFFLTEVAQEVREKAWDIIRTTPQNTYQILTKRPENILGMLPADWGAGWPQVWLGVSVENQEMANLRILQLLYVPAHLRFLSVEPLLGPMTLRYVQYKDWVEINVLADTRGVRRPHAHEVPRISWVVCGGESGPGARPMNPQWAIDIKDECGEAGVPFFMKQMGGWPNTRHRLEDMPLDLQLREFPVGY